MSESVFDKPLNGDLEALSSSVVKSINGKKPDPITGDITVIEGGGSGSYGAYRLDTTIPVSAWSGSGPYTVTVVNELIKSTMDGKSWLDNGTALLGKTTLTSQDGSLLISTPVKPTEDWVLHVSFALNGADVLADSEEQKKAIGKILPVITGTLNNSGYTINTGDYFEANGNLYKANATIPTGESWSSSSDALTTSALSDVNAKIGNVGSTSLQSQVSTLNSNIGKIGLNNYLGEFSTKSALDGYLDSLLSILESGGNYAFRVACTGNVSPFKSTYHYFGTLHKSGSTTEYSQAMVYAVGASDVITCVRIPSGWSYYPIALQSEITYRFFRVPYTGNITKISAEFPSVTAGAVWLAIIANYTSETAIETTMYVVVKTTANKWDFTPIKTNTGLGAITGITNSGNTVTFTFDKTVWASMLFVALL